jgi:transposase
LRLWKCGIDISNGHYSSSLTSANNNNVPIKKEEGIVVTPSAIIHFLDKEETEEANNNNNTSSTNSYSYSNNRKKITTTQFVQKYTSLTDRLSRHFSKPIFANYHNKIFGNLQYIGIRQNIDDQNSKSTPNSQASSVCQ